MGQMRSTIQTDPLPGGVGIGGKPMSIHYDKSIDNRLAAIEGHVRAVRQMLTEDKECEEILLQISAIEGSLSKLASRKVLSGETSIF